MGGDIAEASRRFFARVWMGDTFNERTGTWFGSLEREAAVAVAITPDGPAAVAQVVTAGPRGVAAVAAGLSAPETVAVAAVAASSSSGVTRLAVAADAADERILFFKDSLHCL